MPESLRDPWDWALIRNRCAAEAARILRRSGEAEEAVQEAMVRAWRSRRSCRTPDAPLPWCLQITRNEAFRVLGRQKNLPQTTSLDEDDQIGDHRAVRAGDRVLLRLDVARALERLTPHERLLIGLRYEQDCSHPEIARILQIPEATARVRLHRAQKRLQGALEDDFEAIPRHH
jgi:RNA polymerase sigma-70 factor (ECF subfamily)